MVTRNRAILLALLLLIAGTAIWIEQAHAATAAQVVAPAQPRGSLMTAEAVVTISALVVALTQLVKWLGMPDRKGAVVVLLLALLGVVAYQISYAPDSGIFLRTDLWPILAAWIAVATSAAGVFGFTRTASDSVTSTRTPPAGAGQQPVVKIEQ